MITTEWNHQCVIVSGVFYYDFQLGQVFTQLARKATLKNIQFIAYKKKEMQHLSKYML